MDDMLYLFVNKHIYTVDSYWCIVGFWNSPLRHNGVNTSITLDAANGTAMVLNSIMCYNTILLDHVL